MNLRGEIKSWSAIPASRVASIGVKAMERGRREVIPGLLNKPVPLFGRMLPVRLQLAIVRVVLMVGKAKSLTTIEVWACHVADMSTVRTVPCSSFQWASSR